MPEHNLQLIEMRVLKRWSQSFSTFHQKASRILGVSLSATEEQIRKAYYCRAKQFHPDTNTKSSSNIFLSSIRAYEYMMKKAKQEKATVEEPEISYPEKDEEMFRFYESFKDSEKKEGQPTMDSFFEQFFSKTKKEFKQEQWNQYQEKKARRRDYQTEESEDFENRENVSKKKKSSKELPNYLQVATNLILTPEQAKEGARKIVTIIRRVICHTCLGDPQTEEVKCPKCDGLGLHQDKHGVSYCWTCNGNKVVRRPNCISCKGKGHIFQSFEEKLLISPGMKNNEEIIFERKGHQHLKLKFFGNLVVRLKVVKPQWQKEEQQYRREGDDIHSNVKIGIVEAVLGFQLSYSTPWGRRGVYIEPGVQDGAIVKRKGQGFKKRTPKKEYGDHFITLSIVVPQQLSLEEQEVFQQIRKLQINKQKMNN